MDKFPETRPVSPKRDLKRINRDLLIFAVFLVLSFLFWYLNSLSKVLNTTIRYPVTYVNMPADRKAFPELPSKFSLLLSGPGYSILKLKLGSNGNPLVVDFAETSFITRGSGSDYIVTALLIARFNENIKSDSRILSVKPDTLYFSFR
ncbi:MAG TPA: hypothetical protein PLV06_04590 [Bacteroidales bacterium]|nr:hypothetical protein [Bacteroidales bacterium]HPF03855.1 hypothetical protein [Bacteroidales bacterium]HPJ58466.1 hypothetical protein [Bacteroidales bacterium]HPR11641.1 hypothetical protein [Bacteroidales bacterium]HRW85002.1 hypothetical protein [Bacteroidales bacterium]